MYILVRNCIKVEGFVILLVVFKYGSNGSYEDRGINYWLILLLDLSLFLVNY